MIHIIIRGAMAIPIVILIGTPIAIPIIPTGRKFNPVQEGANSIPTCNILAKS